MMPNELGFRSSKPDNRSTSVALDDPFQHSAAEETRLAALGQTMAGAAHCMKNLALVLRGGIQLVKAELARLGGDKPSRGIEVLEQNVGQLAILVDEMLTYAKESKPSYSRVALSELVRSAVGAMDPLAQERGVDLRVDAAPGIGVVELDHGAVYRCVLNLVSNSIEACEAGGGEVRVRTLPSGDRWVVIEVADQGCGMDEATKGSLFRPFFTTKGAQGTGLGLAVSRRIAEDHGGRIEVASEEGKGATFRVFLPRQAHGAAGVPS